MIEPPEPDYAARLERLERELETAAPEAQPQILAELVDVSGDVPAVRRTTRFAEYVVRLVESDPWAFVLSTPMARLDPLLHADAISRCRTAWRAHLKSKPRSVDLALMASDFLDGGEPNEAEVLLQRFLKYKRCGARVAFRLGSLRQLSPDRRLEYLEQARAKGYRPEAIGPRISWAAWAAGDLDRAHREACALLGGSDGAKDALAAAAREVDRASGCVPKGIEREPWYDETLAQFGTIFAAANRYHAHTVLGLVALKQARTEDAVLHLTCTISSSPKQQLLGVSGSQPLAEALCLAGEWAPVEAYLRRIVELELHPGAEEWLSAIQRRELPARVV